MRRIASIIPSAAGWEVTIEYVNAYTDGSSRFDTITVPGVLDRAQLLQAVRNVLMLRDQLPGLVMGEEV